MRILIDTNILFSAALYPNSVPQRAFEKAVSLPNIGIVSYQSLEEFDDRTIYRAAVKANADIILTGDKDLLESGIISPQIMTAREFLSLYD